MKNEKIKYIIKKIMQMKSPIAYQEIKLCTLRIKIFE